MKKIVLITLSLLLVWGLLGGLGWRHGHHHSGCHHHHHDRHYSST